MRLCLQSRAARPVRTLSRSRSERRGASFSRCRYKPSLPPPFALGRIGKGHPMRHILANLGMQLSRLTVDSVAGSHRYFTARRDETRKLLLPPALDDTAFSMAFGPRLIEIAADDHAITRCRLDILPLTHTGLALSIASGNEHHSCGQTMPSPTLIQLSRHL